MVAVLKIKKLGLNLIANEQSTSLVENLSFTMEKGSTLALVGESGSGKSLTAHAIMRLLPNSIAAKGEIQFAGQSLLDAPSKCIRQIRGREIGMIFQEPMSSLNPLHTVQKQISEVLVLHQGLSVNEAKYRCLELLDEVQINQTEQKLKAYPHQLSGGQRQRVMIAMALANQPKLLIADEPTTALDANLQKQILTLLKDLQIKRNMSLLLISHDLNLVKAQADELIVMQRGKAIEQGCCQTIFSNPQALYTQKLLAAEPQGFPTPYPKDSPELLKIQDLRVWFPIRQGFFQRLAGYKKAVDGINFSLKKGETLGIVGESGSGKTTLALALLNLIKSQGSIAFKGSSIDHYRPKQYRPLRKSLQIVFQDPFGSLSPRMCIADIIAEGLDIHYPLEKTKRLKKIHQTLMEVGLNASACDRYPHEFSGGQRQRIAIARALILKPELIILDEPTSALDRTVQKQIIMLLRELQKRYGFAYIFISHDLSVIKAMSHQMMVMLDGRVVESKPCEELFNNPEHPYSKNLLATLTV